MLWFAAALASASPAADAPAAVQRQARAVVRIIRPAIVRLGEGALSGEQQPQVRETRLPGAVGERRPLILIEFS